MVVTQKPPWCLPAPYMLSHPVSPSFGITMFACGGDLSAPPPGIECVVGPLDFRVLAHRGSPFARWRRIVRGSIVDKSEIVWGRFIAARSARSGTPGTSGQGGCCWTWVDESSAHAFPVIHAEAWGHQLPREYPSEFRSGSHPAGCPGCRRRMPHDESCREPAHFGRRVHPADRSPG